MKKIFRNIMASTGITLVILAVIARIMGAEWIAADSIWECLLANIIVYSGLPVIHKIECRYIFVEAALDIGFISVVLLILGGMFQWYTSTPVWVLILMAVLVYLADVSIQIFRSDKDVKLINSLLQMQNSGSQNKE